MSTGQFFGSGELEKRLLRVHRGFSLMIDAKLVMFRSNGERRDFPLNPDRTLIGRKNDCDVRIPLTEVSRHHAEFLIKDGEVVLKDLGSANGTFVNNKRVEKVKLAAGDHVIVGPAVFTLQIDGEPKEIRPVKTKLGKRAQDQSALKEDSAIAVDAISGRRSRSDQRSWRRWHPVPTRQQLILLMMRNCSNEAPA